MLFLVCTQSLILYVLHAKIKKLFIGKTRCLMRLNCKVLLKIRSYEMSEYVVCDVNDDMGLHSVSNFYAMQYFSTVSLALL